MEKITAASAWPSPPGKHPDELVFRMPGRSVVRLSSWRRAAFIPARACAGTSDRFRVPDLRHTAASLMIQAGYPPKMLLEILGTPASPRHSTCTGTCTPGDMDRYAARLDEAAGMADAAR